MERRNRCLHAGDALGDGGRSALRFVENLRSPSLEVAQLSELLRLLLDQLPGTDAPGDDFVEHLGALRSLLRLVVIEPLPNLKRRLEFRARRSERPLERLRRIGAELGL